ncbi:MAG: FHA domain-containing protein [Actinomycetota bacterium]|nr:FHA domain-containing protein [Actinomycetota bacterium]
MAVLALISPFVIAVLKYAFIALVYFFVYRAIRAVGVEIAGRKDGRRAVPRSESRTKGKGRAPQAVVVKDDDGRKIGSHRLSSTIQIGRAEACHIRLDDTYVSNFHARLYPKDGAWHVEDLGSTNGTYLNRQRVTGSVEIQAGDEVRVGKTTLELKR